MDATDGPWPSATRCDHKQALVSADECKLSAVWRPGGRAAAGQPPKSTPAEANQLNPAVVHDRQAAAIWRPGRRGGAVAGQLARRTGAAVGHEHLSLAFDETDGGESPGRRPLRLPPGTLDIERLKADSVRVNGPELRHGRVVDFDRHPQASVRQKAGGDVRIPSGLIVRRQPHRRNRAGQTAAIGIDHSRSRPPGCSNRYLGSICRPHRIPCPITSRPNPADLPRVRTASTDQDQTLPTGWLHDQKTVTPRERSTRRHRCREQDNQHESHDPRCANWTTTPVHQPLPSARAYDAYPVLSSNNVTDRTKLRTNDTAGPADEHPPQARVRSRSACCSDRETRFYVKPESLFACF